VRYALFKFKKYGAFDYFSESYKIYEILKKIGKEPSDNDIDKLVNEFPQISKILKWDKCL
jgi:hypothetical protein